MIYKLLLKPLLFRLDAEKAHELSLHAARKTGKSSLLSSLVEKHYNFQSPELSQKFWGHTFRNPVGLAAGFDKNGCLIPAMQALGMGFVETGSITAWPSTGNPKPRAFRLPADRALINRMGLNNEGAQAVVRRLQNTACTIPVGINIAKTHSPDIMGKAAIDDYLFSYKEAQKVADYITVNISCPNTAEGKTFEEPDVLNDLLAALFESKSANAVPTLLKFSPDLTKTKLQALLEICEDHRVDGYVATNTSSVRENLRTGGSRLDHIGAGGLSGAPLSTKSLHTVRHIRSVIGSGKPIIGVGGIHSFETALAMLQAGANLLQVYTGLVYEGPGLVKRINQGLNRYMKDNALESPDEI